MQLWDRYYTPHTVEEASELLASHRGEARVIGGGTDLLLDIKTGHQPHFPALVDITHIPELVQITQDGDRVVIGAGVTHRQVVESSLLAGRATCLVESCGVVGGPQVRNVGTLGGNVAHALPAADGTTSLVALDAEAEILKDGARRWLPILELFKGPGQSLVDPTRDLLLKFRFPLASGGEASAFKRVMRPQGVALPILGCAVWVRLGQDGETVEATRVCISPVGPVPARAESVEMALIGKKFGDTVLDNAVRVARRELHPRISKYRATAEYRIEMIEVLLRRSLPLAVHRARTGQAQPEGIGL
jgi:carbon-monoxide dehydrogenase medium subunit